MATEAKEAEKFAADVVEITFLDVITGEIGAALVAIKAYEHPDSRCGVRTDTSIKLGRLTRLLRGFGEEYADEYNAIGDRYGERKDENDPKSWKIAPDSPFRSAFNADIQSLKKKTVQIDAKLRIRRSELRVRDMSGELVDMDCGRIGDLGPLLDEEEGPIEKPKPRSRRQRPGA